MTKAFKIKHRYPWSIMQTAIKMYENRYTSREVSSKLREIGVIVSHKVILEWVKKFGKEANLKHINTPDLCQRGLKKKNALK